MTLTRVPESVPGISRFEYSRSQGWLARFYAPGGVVTQKLFSDSRYGFDARRARAAALQWLVTQGSTYDVRPRYRQRTRGNTTGRVGICLYQKVERGGAAFWVYAVCYVRHGKRHTKTFRIHLYTSQQEAFAAATSFRVEMERAMCREKQHVLIQTWQDALATQEEEHPHAPLTKRCMSHSNKGGL